MNNRWFAVVALAVVMTFSASPDASQRPNELKSVMREKLGHAQKILEAVVTSDWAKLETESRELEQLTNDPRWTVLKSPEYSTRSAAFIRAIQDLHQAALQRDLDKTPQAYLALTMKCVECHRYLARARVAAR
jgi:hypothetical protein